MIFCNLGSGSKGNSSYLRNDRKAILIDQGFSLKNLVTRFARVNLRPEDVAAIVVTHDLAVARLLSHRTIVMRHGRVIETGLTDQVLDDPQEAYTQLLVSSIIQA